MRVILTLCCLLTLIGCGHHSFTFQDAVASLSTVATTKQVHWHVTTDGYTACATAIAQDGTDWIKCSHDPIDAVDDLTQALNSNSEPFSRPRKTIASGGE